MRLCLVLFLCIAGQLCAGKISPCFGQDASVSDSSPARLSGGVEHGLTLNIMDLGRARTPLSVPAQPVSGKPSSVTLRGSVHHSDTLPEVDSAFRAGLTFNATRLPKLIPGNKWHWIPNWYAGHWQTETNTVYYRYDLRTGYTDNSRTVITSRSQEDVGFQMDSEGGIWEYEYAPYTAFTESDTTFTVQMIRSLDCMEATPHKVVCRFVGTNIKVDKASRQIRSVDQVESIQTYTPAGRNLIQCASSIKSFDAHGRPVQLQKNVSAKLRTQGFRRTDVSDGRDLRSLFREFLLSRGLQRLLPQ